METLEKLKSCCNDKKQEAVHLKKALDRTIIENDLQLYFNQNHHLTQITPNKYRSDFFEVQIVEYDYIISLEITDNRGLLPYTWLYRLEYKNFKCRIYDHFLYQSRLHSVSKITSTQDANLIRAIEDVIDDFDRTLAYLRKHKEANLYTYTYEFEDEKKACSCPSIADVFETVSANILYPK